jgi:uncharacterized protein YraI
MRAHLRAIAAACGLLAASTIDAAAFPGTVTEPTQMREGPSPEFAPLVELPPGSRVEVLNCDPAWCEASVEDFDGFIPRRALSLGTFTPPVYVFPPLIAVPGRWHGRYYSRDHYRYESRWRWRHRDGRRIHVLPPLVQPVPLKPLVVPVVSGKKKFEPKGPPPATLELKGTPAKKFEPKGPPPKRLELKGPAPKKFEPKGAPADKKKKKGP